MADVLTIARGEIGTKEQPSGSNRVKYNTWYYRKEVSGAGYAWCMAFVQWCYEQSGNSLPLLTASCGALLRWYQRYQPECIIDVDCARAGDVVIFDFPGGAATDHCGILEGIGKETVTTIDGNTGISGEANGGAVLRRTRSRKYVRAVIRPREIVKAQVPALAYGAKGDAVKAMQALLNLRGNEYIACDGSFGPITRKAVLNFQESAKIDVDGSVGPVTWTKLLNG